MFRHTLTVGIIFFLSSNLLLFLALSHLYMEGPKTTLELWGIGAIAVCWSLLVFWQYYRSLEEIAKSRQPARQGSGIDETTGLSDKYRFLERFHAFLKGLRGRRVSSALLMIDMDFFKSVNDFHGHAVGDKVVRHVARIVSRQLRDDDLVGRYGGGAFIVLLPRIRAGEAYRVAERIRTKVAQHPFIAEEGGRIGVTVSIGVTEAFADREGLQIIGDAAAALQRAKSKGRNRVEAGGTGGV